MTLTQLFTNIANAIRSKKGTSGTIIAENFPTEISSIVELKGQTKTVKSTLSQQTITPDNNYNGITQVTVQPINLQNKTVTPTSSQQTINADNGYDGLGTVIVEAGGSSEYNAKVSTTPASTSVKLVELILSIPLINTSNALDMTYMFNGCNALETVPQLSTGNVTSMSNMFSGCSALKTVPQLSTGNVTSMKGMFNGCSALKTVPQFSTGNVSNMSNMFNSCTRLETVPQLSTGNVTNMSNMFSSCPSLSNESLDNILVMCCNATKITNANYKKLSYIGLTSAQATTCQGLSQYQRFLNAGWTTGY